MSDLKDRKEDSGVTENPIRDAEIVEKDGDNFGIAERYRGTVADRRDMSIMGKKQVLRVRV